MMKRTWLRLLFMAGTSMTLISCGNEVPASQNQPGINEEGKLASPFDEGLSKAELDNIPKADDHLLVKISSDKNLPSDRTLNSLGIRELTRLYASGDWYQASLKEDTRIDKALKDLEGANPTAILARGYSVVTDKKTGKVIRSDEEVSSGSVLEIKPAKGSFTALVQ